MTSADVITTRVRAILSDASAVIWADAALLAFLNDAMRIIWSRRADARYESDGTFKTFAEAAAVGSETLVLDNRFMAHLQDYVLARAYQVESEDARHERLAAEHMSLFTQWLGVV